MLSRPKWENYILSVVNMSKQDVLSYIKSHSDPSISASLVDGNGRSNRKFNWLFWIFDRTQDGSLDRKELGELHKYLFDVSLTQKKWYFFAVRARPRRSRTLSVSHFESVLYGGFVWARRARNGRKRRFPARAVAAA